MPKKFVRLSLAVSIGALVAVLGQGQTTTELLQKGIFAQETEGNLDSAIAVYRQIVNSAPAQRDLAAQAQYRLAQALLQKGDLTNAATEFSKLARDYSDYKNLISNMAALARTRLAAGNGPGGGPGNVPGAGPGTPGGRSGGPSPQALASLTFDPNRPVTIRGKAVMAMFANPAGIIMVDPGNGTERYLFSTAAPNQMERQGFTRNTIKPGEEIVVNGILAAGGAVEEGPGGRVIGARAVTVSLANGMVVFDRARIEDAAK